MVRCPFKTKSFYELFDCKLVLLRLACWGLKQLSAHFSSNLRRWKPTSYRLVAVSKSTRVKDESSASQRVKCRGRFKCLDLIRIMNSNSLQLVLQVILTRGNHQHPCQWVLAKSLPLEPQIGNSACPGRWDLEERNKIRIFWGGYF